jgi:hypothetical protein
MDEPAAIGSIMLIVGRGCGGLPGFLDWVLVLVVGVVKAWGWRW